MVNDRVARPPGLFGLVAVLVVAGVLLLTGPSSAQAAPFTITFQLSPNQITPPPTTTASGFVQLILETETNEVRYAFTVFGVAADQVTGIHLHRGGIGEHGPTLATLSPGGTNTGSGPFAVAPPDAAALLQGGLYVDLH